MKIVELPALKDIPFDAKKLSMRYHEPFARVLPTVSYLLVDEMDHSGILVNASVKMDVLLPCLEKEECYIRYVFFTDGRFNHLYHAGELAEKIRAPFYLHPDEQKFLSVYLEEAWNNLGIRLPLPYNGEYTAYGEGTIFTLDDLTIETFHTPGASSGAVTLAVRDKAGRHVLFTGALLGHQTVGDPGNSGGSPGLLLTSLKWLKGLPGDWDVYPSHCGRTSLAHERETNLATLPRVRIAEFVALHA
jgi:glyoxylase-like metal-dependent hydrolase (beta-lactamase superfamily II)